tara:strand:- start:1811 stop:2224 length:414 start_codon:yes stop_codon:yes gene_type:complete
MIVFWLINEIPSVEYLKLNKTETIATIVSIPIVGILFSKLLYRRMKKTEKNLYYYSVLTLGMTWVLILYSKAIILGIVRTIEIGQLELFDSIIGYSIYQLWLFLGLGIINGIIGGIFLKIDLIKNLNKIINGTQQGV